MKIIDFGIKNRQKMDINHQIKQERFDEEEMLMEPTTTNNYLKRASEINEHSQPTKKRTFNYSAQELNNFEQNLVQKCHSRGGVPTIYNPPFYELQSARPEHGDKVVARCCSCNVLLRGSKSITSNFIKHMKNSHPKIYLVYQRIKTLKSTRKLESSKNNKYSKTEHEMPVRASITLDSTSNGGASCDAAEQVSENTEYSATLSNYSNEEDIVEADVTTAESPFDMMHQQQRHQLPHLHQHTSNGDDGADLSFQMLNTMSSLLDEKLKVFITKDDFNEEIKQIIAQSLHTNREPTAPSTNPDVCKLQEQVDRLEKACKELRTAMKYMQQSKRQMQLSLQAIDRKFNQCKLIIKNIQIENDEKPQETVEKLLHDELDLKNVTICKVEVVLKNNKNSSPNEMQNVYVEVKSEADVDLILKNCYKLSQSGIHIERQQSIHLRRQQSKLLVLRKEILKRKPDIKTCIRDAELIVEGITFYWDDIECLCLNSYTDEDLNAVGCLNRLTNNDFTEFINFLRNYEVRVEK